MVAFLIDPAADVTRQGTVGDMAEIPPPRIVPALRALSALGLLRVAMGLRRRGG